jgi:hypothetical protein
LLCCIARSSPLQRLPAARLSLALLRVWLLQQRAPPGSCLAHPVLDRPDTSSPAAAVDRIMADMSAESIQQRIQVARRDAEALKDRIKRKKDELADTTRMLR